MATFQAGVVTPTYHRGTDGARGYRTIGTPPSYHYNNPSTTGARTYDDAGDRAVTLTVTTGQLYPRGA